MKLAFIVVGLPNPLTGGGALTAYNTLSYFKKRGHEIIALILLDDLTLSESDQAKVKGLELICDQIHFLLRQQSHFSFLQKVKNKVVPTIESLYPEISLGDKVREILDQYQPEALFLYEFQPQAAAFCIKDIPKMALAGDPPFEVLKYRFFYAFYENNWKTWMLWPIFPWLYFKLKRADLKLIQSAKIKGAYAHHHANCLEKLIGSEVKYYRTPMTDPFDGQAELLYEKIKSQKGKFTLALLGHLKGISTLAGIYLFADKILPRLVQEIGLDNFEVLVVGRYFKELPRKWQEKLTKGPVKIIEFAPNLEEVMAQSDVFFVPTPIELGVRVRIITALSYASLILTHQANQLGIPELKDGYNCLVGKDDQELTQKIIGIYQKKYDTFQIRQNARRTFQEYFEASKAVGEIERDLQRLIV